MLTFRDMGVIMINKKQALISALAVILAIVAAKECKTIRIRKGNLFASDCPTRNIGTGS